MDLLISIFKRLIILNKDKYTLLISRCIATARERILGSIDNYVTGVRECSQQRGNLKDDGYSKKRRKCQTYTCNYCILISILQC
ncbi:hypothetical protein [Photorhabdus sp. RW14-46]|uniref:hypothetical protein n=1 Tax=Photorhabdus sp. RW14-46 TaxID=2100168 RepID=UPI001A985949|nr:hypothetical protein [Photorhabdus sp. RW14-46]